MKARIARNIMWGAAQALATMVLIIALLSITGSGLLGQLVALAILLSLIVILDRMED